MRDLVPERKILDLFRDLADLCFENFRFAGGNIERFAMEFTADIRLDEINDPLGHFIDPLFCKQQSIECELAFIIPVGIFRAALKLVAGL